MILAAWYFFVLSYLKTWHRCDAGIGVVGDGFERRDTSQMQYGTNAAKHPGAIVLIG